MNDYSQNLQRSIDYIEDHLKDKLSLDRIIQCSGYSTTHFYRIFQAITGQSLKEYITLRRLSNAAYELAATDRRLIDIAFDFNFNSQEVFTRAFVRAFMITPASYRKSKEGIQICERLKIDQLVQAAQASFYNPPILLEKTFTLVGIEQIVLPGDLKIQQLWNEFLSRQNEIVNQIAPDKKLGICEYMPNITDESEFSYFACCEVSSVTTIPDNMTAKTIPLAKYAVFTHNKSMSVLKDTYRTIYGAWLPSSNHQLAEMDTIECYTESGLNIYIPIK